MKRRIMFITGGASSGKSTFAETLAQKYGKEEVTVLATAAPSDAEMRRKIRAHQRARPESWTTLEIGTTPLVDAIDRIATPVTILDCLTLFVSTGLVKKRQSPSEVTEAVSTALGRMCTHSRCKTFIIVSNEVGSGIVPDNRLARLFRETLGAANKLAMAHADEAHLLVAGHPLRLK